MVKKITELPKELKPPKPPLTFEGALTALNDPSISSEDWVKTYGDVYKAGREPTPIEPVAPLEPIALPQTPDELFSLMETVLPEMTVGFGFTREELIPQALENLEILAQERPEDLITQLRERGRTPESETLLSMLGATPEDIDLIFEEEPFIEPPPLEVEPVFVELDGIRQLVTRTEDNSLYDTNGNWIGYYNWADGTVFNPYKAEGLAEKALASFTAGIGDILSTSGGVARRLGYDEVASKLSTVASQLQLYGVPSSSFETSDLLSPEFYATKITRTIPFALSLAPLAIGGFYGGTALATAAGLGTVWTMVVGGLTGAALSRPLESAMEAGSSYDDAIARGKTHEEASAEFDEVFRNNMLLVGADAWEIAIALAPTPKWVPVSLIKAGLVRTARIAGKMVIVGLSEGGEEIYQDMVQRHARGEEWKLDAISKEVFAIGFVMGAGMGLGGDVISSIVNSSKNKMPARMKKDFDDSVSGFKEEGFRPDQSELKALDEVAKTPEGERIIQRSVDEAKVEPEVPAVGERVTLQKGSSPFLSPSGILSNPSISHKEAVQKAVGSNDVYEYMEQTGNIRIIVAERELNVGMVKPLTEAQLNVIKEVSTGKGIIYDIADSKGNILRSGTVDNFDEFIKQIAKPPVVKEVKVPEIPEVTKVEPVEDSKGAIEPPLDEIIPSGVAKNSTVVHDITAIEFVRGSRHVFEKMGIYDIWEGATEAEVEIEEANVAFNKEIDALEKSVSTAGRLGRLIGKGKERYGMIFDAVDNPGSVTGLLFEEKQAVSFIKKFYDEWANKKNLPQPKRIENYITHIFEQEMIDQVEAGMGIPPEIASILSEKVASKITDPFLKERLGAVGFIRDPFNAMRVYNAVSNRVLYYEPSLQKISVIANDRSMPELTRTYLKDYSRRMTGKQSPIDSSINKWIAQMGEMIRPLPGGEFFADRMTKGNPVGAAFYNLTSALYLNFLGLKATSAIRNLSQHSLILAEVGPKHFANSIRLRFTQEGKAVLREVRIKRGRKISFLAGIDASFADNWLGKFREMAMVFFRGADSQNVSNAVLGGYSEAKGILTEANNKLPSDKKLSSEELRDYMIRRGDEVGMDTQFVYTKMNSMAAAQNGPGRALSMLTTWTENWIELMVKWISRRPSKVYTEFSERTGIDVKRANWSTSYKAISMYIALVAFGYAVKERERLRALEYTGFTSLRYLAGIVGGEFPVLQAPGAAMDIINGVLFHDDTMLKKGWSEFRSVMTPGIIKQATSLATGEKDWLTMLFYMKGKDFKINKLKDTWEKGWDGYPLFETPEDKTKYVMAHPKQAGWSADKMRKQWRVDNPKLEAQMFVTSRFSTLSSEEARQEVLRLIEKHDIDVELIDGYEKIFGIDTTVELSKFQKRIGNLEKFEVGEEAKYFTVGSFLTELNATVKTQGRAKVEMDGHAFSIFLLAEQDSWQPYEDYDAKGALLYRQQFPSVEASLYLVGKITAFQNPESAKILLGIMDKYNIPPQAIRAFNDNPDKYDELFTQKFELEQKSFELDTLYENYGNSKSDAFIPKDETITVDGKEVNKRDWTREELKEDNPIWVANTRRVEAIDNDVPDKLDGMNGVDAWAERGAVADKFNANSAEDKVWFLDHPQTHTWARSVWADEDKFNPTDWNEPVLRIDIKYRTEEEALAKIEDPVKRKAYYNQHTKFRDDGRRVDIYKLEHKGVEVITPTGILKPTDVIEDYVVYMIEVDKYTSNSAEANLLRVKYGDLDKIMVEAGEWQPLEFTHPQQVKIWEINKQYRGLDTRYDEDIPRQKEHIEDIEKMDIAIAEARAKLLDENKPYAVARYTRDAYELEVPDKHITDYVGWHINPDLKRPDDWDENLGWYEDDWWLQEHKGFYREVYINKDLMGNDRRDYREVPPRDVFKKYLGYRDEPQGLRRNEYRWRLWKQGYSGLEDWLLLAGKVTVHIKDKDIRGELTSLEKLREQQAKGMEGIEEMKRRLARLTE